MPQGTDIELAGAGYMIAPGSYRRTHDAPHRPAAAAGGRVAIRDFAGGQRQALFPLAASSPAARGGGRGWDAVGVGPAYDGQGVEPWGNEAAYVDALSDQPTVDRQAFSVIVRNRCYVAIGRRLYQSVALTDGAWASFTVAADLGAGVEVSGLARYKDDLLIFCGAASTIRKYNTATGIVTNPWVAGEKGTVGIGYRGQVLFATGLDNDNFKLRLSVDKFDGTLQFRNRYADAEIVNLGSFGGEVVVATRTSLLTFGGDWDPGETGVKADWRGELEGLFTHGTWTAEDDFVFLLGYAGRLYTWLANRVVVFDPGLGGGWRKSGPEGTSCYGATVAAGYLTVSVVTRTGESETWAHDGAGWWRLQLAAGSPARVWPVALGGAGNRDLLLFRAGSTTYDLYRLVARSTTLHGYRATAEWVSSLLDAGEREAAKAWRKVGASFAVPEARGNQASADAVTVRLDFSLDGGKTWATAATATLTDATKRTHEVEAALASNAATSRYLQLRVVWESVLDWAPVLTGVWAEHEPLANEAKRRRWRLDVLCRDGQIRRDGGVQARSGRQLAADLWTAWETGATVSFRDLDYDATARTHQVRVVDIEEAVAAPGDAGRWGESTVALALVEV